MTDLRKAAEMAIEVLERTGTVGNYAKEQLVIQRLRQALAQPEQEPVIGMFEEKLPDQNPPPWVRDYKAKERT